MHLRELLTPADYAEHQALVQKIAALETETIELLPKVEAESKPKTLDQTAASIGLSREYTRLIQSKALRRLQRNPVMRELKDQL